MYCLIKGPVLRQHQMKTPWAIFLTEGDGVNKRIQRLTQSVRLFHGLDLMDCPRWKVEEIVTID